MTAATLTPRATIGLPPSEAATAQLQPEAVLHYSTGEELGVTDFWAWWRNIRHHHVKRNGWSDIGYHIGIPMTVRELLEGRPLDRIGAHAGTSAGNRKVGICMLGDDDPGQDVTGAGYLALVDAIVLLDRHFSRLAGDHDVRVRISLHRDHKPTTCPGDEIAELVQSGRLRADADRRHAYSPQDLEDAVRAMLLIHPTEGVPDAVVGFWGLLADAKGVHLVADPDEARKALAVGIPVHAIGGPACDLVAGDHDLRGATRLNTGRKVYEAAARGWHLAA